MALSDTDVAYTAGMIDGEGCIYGRLIPYKKSGRKHAQLYVSICGQEKEHLEDIAAMWGVGAMESARTRRDHVLYRIRWQNRSEIVRLLVEVLPYLRIKKAQAITMLEAIGILNQHTGNPDEYPVEKLQEKFDLLKTQKRSGFVKVDSPKMQASPPLLPPACVSRAV